MGNDRITANLPSSDFAATVVFYGRLGFSVAYRGDHWLILEQGALELEFFAHPGVDKGSSWFSACVRVDDPDALFAEWQGAGLSSDPRAIPRLTGFFVPPGAPRMFALVDADGSLLRVIDNRSVGGGDG